MSDLRKAAELALEVMEYNRAKGTPNMGAAMEALRQALNVDAVNMSQERVDETAKRKHECPDWDFLEINEDSPEFESCLCYTAPQKRKWVGLTVEEKQYLNEVLNLQGRFPIIDAIEAKLKEKNA